MEKAMCEKDFQFTLLEYAPECQLERLIEQYPGLPVHRPCPTSEPDEPLEPLLEL